MTDGIKEELKTRKYQHFAIDKIEIENAIWKLLTKRMKFSTQERVSIVIICKCLNCKMYSLTRSSPKPKSMLISIKILSVVLLKL